MKRLTSLALMLIVVLFGCAEKSPLQTDAPQNKQTIIDISGAPFKGPENAKIVMVEFADFGCSWCRGYARDRFPQVESEFIETGRIKYVFMDFSVNSTGSRVAEAGNCAAEQDKFWEMHDELFANQGAQSPLDIIDYAEAIGLDMPRFRECTEHHKYAARVVAERGQGRRLGVEGTPAFFLGVAESEDKVRVVKMFTGIKSYDALKAALEELLSSHGK
jgi:protein-disulfide isomerase